MTGIVVLFAASVAEGFLLGYFSIHWLAVAVSGLVLALTAAWVLQAHGFGIAGGIATVVVCLTLNQFMFLCGCLLRMCQENTADDGE